MSDECGPHHCFNISKLGTTCFGVSFYEVNCLLGERVIPSLPLSVLPGDVLLLFFTYSISTLAISYFLENEILGLGKSLKLCAMSDGTLR